MNVQIILAQNTPEKTTTFEEWHDEVMIRVKGEEASFPHTNGNLVAMISLLDKLYQEAREHIIAQMDDHTAKAIPALVYVPDDKTAEVMAIMEAR